MLRSNAIKIVLVAGSLLLACSVNAAMKQLAMLQPQMTIERFGIYESLKNTRQSFNAEATAGYDSVIGTQFKQQTAVIPLRQGLVFGFDYVLDHTAAGTEWLEVDVEISHPETTNYLGHHSTGFKTRSAVRLKADGRYHNGVFYVFSEPYEMVPGQWQITVSYDNAVSVTQTFMVQDR